METAAGTVKKSHPQISHRRKHREQLLKALQVLYPKVFDRISPLPLAEKMHLEIQGQFPQASRTLIKGFLRWWTRRAAYLRAMVLRMAQRSHLDGTLCLGNVSALHREHAKSLLKEIRKERAIQNAKREAAGKSNNQKTGSENV